MYRLCIFDLDGTLTDTLDSLTYSVNETLQVMKLQTITREQCRVFVGNGTRVLMENALRVSGDKEGARIEEAMEVFGRIFNVNCTYHVVSYDGIETLLEVLKARGMALAVLSNKPHLQAVQVVEEIFGKQVFSWVQGQKYGVPKKPDPIAALRIAKELNVLPEETIYIGDSEVDIATGAAARMRTIGVTWGFREREQLKEVGAHDMVDSPDEILDLLTKFGG